MAIYKAGIKTKDKIVEAASILFYEKGYAATTYADICEMVGIRQGNLHYHFRSKDAICHEVLQLHLEKNFDDTYLFIKDEHHDFLRHILSNYCFWYKYFNDERYRRFAYETVVEYASSNIQEYYKSYFTSIGKNPEAMDHHSELDRIACAAVESSLPKYMYTKFEEYTYEEIAAYNARVYGHYLGPDDKDQLEEAIQQAEKIMHTADLSNLTFRL